MLLSRSNLQQHLSAAKLYSRITTFPEPFCVQPLSISSLLSPAYNWHFHTDEVRNPRVGRGHGRLFLMRKARANWVASHSPPMARLGPVRRSDSSNDVGEGPLVHGPPPSLALRPLMERYDGITTDIVDVLHIHQADKIKAIIPASIHLILHSTNSMRSKRRTRFSA